MTDIERIEKIAEVCGYKRQTAEANWYDAPDGSQVHWDDIPDYLNDLNAMHEAEKSFPHPSDFYQFILSEVCGGGNRIYRATAAQRAEAFLKTLNLWKNDAGAKDHS
jgi:hypothetical protein